MYFTIGLILALIWLAVCYIGVIAALVLDHDEMREAVSDEPAIWFLGLPLIGAIAFLLLYPMLILILAVVGILYATNDKAKEEISKLWNK